jgi:hypothetical protein
MIVVRWNLYLVIVNLARVLCPTLNQYLKIQIVNIVKCLATGIKENL